MPIAQVTSQSRPCCGPPATCRHRVPPDRDAQFFLNERSHASLRGGASRASSSGPLFLFGTQRGGRLGRTTRLRSGPGRFLASGYLPVHHTHRPRCAAAHHHPFVRRVARICAQITAFALIWPVLVAAGAFCSAKSTNLNEINGQSVDLGALDVLRRLHGLRRPQRRRHSSVTARLAATSGPWWLIVRRSARPHALLWTPWKHGIRCTHAGTSPLCRSSISERPSGRAFSFLVHLCRTSSGMA